MKFEYGGKENGRECVAFIDEDGDLWIKEHEGSVVIYKDGKTPTYGNAWIERSAVKKFYPGDKLTITF